MTAPVTDRELLWELVQKPIGSRALQAEADRIARSPDARPSAELQEAIERTSKKWLPAGKRSTNGPEERAKREAFFERQTDLEDAVEAAGGQRGEAAA